MCMVIQWPRLTNLVSIDYFRQQNHAFDWENWKVGQHMFRLKK